MKTIVISISVPDGVFVEVKEVEVANQKAAPAPVLPPQAPQCPTHHGARYVPAGTSKKTGNPYKAFYGCTERLCNWRVDA